MKSSYHKDFAPFYNIISSHRAFSKDIDELANAFDLNNKSILDFGCGTGKHLNLMSSCPNISPKYLLGYDPSVDLLSNRKPPKANSIDCRFTNTFDSIDNHFDLIVSWCEPLNFVHPSELGYTIQRLLGLTEEKGNWLFEVWNPDSALNKCYQPVDRVFPITHQFPSLGLDESSTAILRTCSVELSQSNELDFMRGTLRFKYKLYELPEKKFITSTIHTVNLFDLHSISRLLPASSRIFFGTRPDMLSASDPSSISSSTIFMRVDF